MASRRQLGFSHYDSPQADGANQRPPALTPDTAKDGLVYGSDFAPLACHKRRRESGDALVTVSSAAFGD